MEELALKERILEQLKGLPEARANELREKIEEMNAEEFEKFLHDFAVPLQDCLFCQIAQGKISTVKIYESQNILAILDIYPATKGHILVMPKQHYQFLTQLPDALLFELFAFVKHIIPAIVRILKSQGVTLNVLQGKEQKVPHFAINIIPRFKDDRLDFTFKRQKIPTEELETLAEQIRKKAGEMAGHIAEPAEKRIAEKEDEEQINEIKEEENKEAEQEAEKSSDEVIDKETEENEESKAKITSNVEFSEEELEKFFKGRIPH